MIFAYPIMLLPSIVYSWVMEKRIRKKKENSLFYFGAAGLLGWLCSLVLAISGIEWDLFAFFSLVGILTGISTAWILRRIDISNEIEPNGCEPSESGNGSRRATS